MKFVQEVEKIQKENEGSIILAKNGIFFVAIGKDAIILHEELGLKLTCMRKELCKTGYPADYRNFVSPTYYHSSVRLSCNALH